MCCGLFGVQIVWGLQNVNTSRIFQTLGADVAELPMLWIAGPIAGLIVQPIIGQWSDRTRGPLGRRRPFLLAGAFLTALSLLLMPNVTSVWTASAGLWLLTISINVVMEPFRALLADVLPEEQRDAGFAMQVLFIGSGAVFASLLPWIFGNWLGWSGGSSPDGLPPSVHAAFYTGAAGVLLTVLWSVVATREPPAPAEVASAGVLSKPDNARQLARRGGVWVLLAAGGTASVAVLDLHREGYLLCGVIAAYGVIQLLAAWPSIRFASQAGAVATAIITMPRVMRRLAWTQFATWFGLFAMWVYLVPAVANLHYGAPVAGSARYNEAADAVGILFAAYNGCAALFALLLPAIVGVLGRRGSHALCLAVGALGFAGIGAVDDPGLLWLPTAAIGCAWGSVLSTPYAMVASAVPPERVGVYMGIHNMFLVLPQLAAAAVLGPMIGNLFGDDPTRALDIAAAAFLIAAVLTFLIPRESDPLAPDLHM
ncbi:SLC45 family MFS transporter [Sphingomonas piscis]|uniref:SLC45 family MFS transporter n=1 Tax=Sphingomonas piscis TaxID=2714943 RepID=A0A6G7YT44_9SPHN|nr:SLC45 family MFS transporter [Sphingomonas piscis]